MLIKYSVCSLKKNKKKYIGFLKFLDSQKSDLFFRKMQLGEIIEEQMYSKGTELYKGTMFEYQNRSNYFTSILF